MKMKSKMLIALMSLFTLGMFTASAVTVTNTDGTVFTIQTLSEDAADVRDDTVRDDQSNYPDQDHRDGVIVRDYDFAEDAATGVVQLQPALPDNLLIYDGYVLPMTAVTPATNLLALHVIAAGDILASSTNLGVTTTRVVVPNSDAAAVATTNNSYVNLTIANGGTLTAGRFKVILKALKAQ